jgi:hypothetical protein
LQAKIFVGGVFEDSMSIGPTATYTIADVPVNATATLVALPSWPHGTP